MIDIKELESEILRLARRIRRFSFREEGFNRQDRLRLILMENEGISNRGLARKLDIRPPSLSQWLDKLEEEGEIERRRDDRDARKTRIHLTDRGRALAKVSLEREENRPGLFQGALSQEELESFIKISGKLQDFLDEKKKEVPEKKDPR